MTTALHKLHDDVNVQSFERILETIDTEFGGKCWDIFDSIDPIPIGSGCIAQVHKGKLKESGTVVAIKVLRDGLAPLIQRDLAILGFIAGCVNFLPTMHWLGLPEEVEQFSHLMNAQLDLRLEAHNLRVFRWNFRDETVKFMFPMPIAPYISQKVLVEEFIDGVPMGKFLSCGNTEVREMIAELGLNAFLKMMVIDNMIHSDLHPGNIFVQFRKEGHQLPTSEIYSSDGNLDETQLRACFDQGYRPALAFIDAGLVTTLTEENMTNFIDLFVAIADGDGSKCARLMVERSRAPEPRCKDYFGFDAKMRVIIERVQKKTFQLANIKIGNVLMDVFSCVREHHVKIESDFTNLIVSIMILEGLGRQLDHNIDLFAAARPFLRYRDKNFYTQHGGLFLKLSAFVEARFWIKKEHSDEYAIVDELTFNNF